MTARRLLSELDSDEFEYWREFYRLNPFDGQRADLHAGIVASAMYNAWGGKTKPADFMPDFSPADTAERLNGKQLSEKIKGLFSHKGGAGCGKGRKGSNGGNRPSRHRPGSQER